jgi:hypothetical protein
MKKICIATFVLLYLCCTAKIFAQSGSFQQLTFTAGSGQFGKIFPSMPVKAGPAYSGRFNWGFYPLPRLFVDFGIAASFFEASYEAVDYSSPTGEIAIFRQKLFMFSNMAGAGVCLGNRNLHVLLGAHATLNIMSAEKSSNYYIAARRDLGVGVAPHADISFRAGKHLLLGISGQAMFFPGVNKKETGLTGSYLGGGIHLQRAN